MRPVALLALLCLAACHKGEPQLAPLKLAGGKEVSAEVLQQGWRGYTQYCRACHGEKGDGTGPAGAGLRPPPRNFTKAVFKFGATLPRDDAPTLPRDEDLRRIIQGGLHGSAMLAWDIQQPQLDAIIQYLKTFSPRWQQEEPGDPLVPSADPFAKEPQKGAALGARLYHSVAQCSSCHPAFGSKAEITAWAKETNPDSTGVDFRPDLYAASPTDSKEYSVDGQHPLRIMPPDFTRRALRSVRPNHEAEDLYRVVSLGIPGTGMPPWRETLSEENIWAIAHYVQGLVDLRDTPGAAGLAKRVAAENATWEAAHAAPDAGAAADGG